MTLPIQAQQRNPINRFADVAGKRKFTDNLCKVVSNGCKLVNEATKYNPPTAQVGRWFGAFGAAASTVRAGVKIWDFFDDIKPSEKPQAPVHKGLGITANVFYAAGDSANALFFLSGAGLVRIPEAAEKAIGGVASGLAGIGLGFSFVDCCITVSEQNHDIAQKNAELAQDNLSPDPVELTQNQVDQLQQNEKIAHNRGVDLRNGIADAKETRKRTVVDMVKIIIDVASIVLGFVALGLAALIPVPIFAIPAAILGIISGSIGIWKLWDDTKVKAREQQLLPA